MYVRAALFALRNWKLLVAAATFLLLLLFVMIYSVVFATTAIYSGEPQVIERYKIAAMAEGVNWKEVYAVDAIRYNFDFDKADPDQTTKLFITHEKITVKVMKDGKETVEEKEVRKIRPLQEVVSQVGFSQSDAEEAYEIALNVEDETYGGDSGDFIPPKWMDRFKAAEKKFGVPWYVVAGIWQGTNGNITLPPEIWEKYKVDGNGDGRADPITEEDLWFTIANYLKNTNNINGIVPQQQQEQVQNKIEDMKRLKDLQNTVLGVYPVFDYHTISSPYGDREGRGKPHKGVDFAAPIGAKIIAIADGVVIATIPTESSGGYGNLTIIQHNGFQTYYAHQSAFAVAPGMHVTKGDLIGYIGTTGQSTGPHLHFEVRVNGQPVNPMPYLH